MLFCLECVFLWFCMESLCLSHVLRLQSCCPFFSSIILLVVQATLIESVAYTRGTGIILCDSWGDLEAHVCEVSALLASWYGLGWKYCSKSASYNGISQVVLHCQGSRSGEEAG